MMGKSLLVVLEKLLVGAYSLMVVADLESGSSPKTYYKGLPNYAFLACVRAKNNVVLWLRNEQGDIYERYCISRTGDHYSLEAIG